MATDLAALGSDLRAALVRRSERRRVHRRRLVVTTAAAVVASALAAGAIASGITGDLQLDPAKWRILGAGSVDEGRGAYVHAQRRSDDSNSTFMVEHDAGLAPYDAFLLHEKTRAEADATSPVPERTEPGPLCSAAQLTRAETVALSTLRVQFAPGADADTTRASVDAAVRNAFADAPCRGLEYGGEQARLFYSGVMPASRLMPGVN